MIDVANLTEMMSKEKRVGVDRRYLQENFDYADGRLIRKIAKGRRFTLFLTAMIGETACPFCENEWWPFVICPSCGNTGIRRDILRQTF